MGLITRSAYAGLDVSSGQFATQLAGLIAGEDLDAVAPCYIKSSDGKIYMSNGTSANEAAEVVGFSPREADAGEPITLYGPGAIFRYGSGLTPGNILYVGATAGRLDSGATTGDAFGVVEVISATDVRVIAGNPRLTSATVGDGTITTAKLASDAVTTVKITDVNVTAAKLEAGGASAGIYGTQVRFTADANVIGGVPVMHRIDVADGTTGNVDVVLTHKTLITNVWLVKTAAAGGASDTITVKNSTTAITDAMDINVADKVVVQVGTIDDAQSTVSAGGTLRVTRTKVSANNVACTVYVLGLRVA